MMAGKWHRRAGHTRRGKDGRIAYVRETMVYMQKTKQRSDSGIAYRQECPECGARIVSVQMKNGGWAHFEGGRGLGRIKHPCFDRGRGLSKRRDQNTPDLFDNQVEDPDDGHKL